MMIVYGKNVIREAAFVNRKFHALYVDERFSDDYFLKFLADKGVRYVRVNKEKLNQLSKHAVHQGVVADVEDYQYSALEPFLKMKGKKRFIILDGIEDPHNLGAMLRTAEATQLTGMIVAKKNQVPLNATVAKVSSGAIEHVPIILVSNINQTIKTLKDNGIWVIGTDGHTDKSFYDIPKSESTAIILGNEGSGIRPLVKQNCDYLVKIPMYGKINSLNVSVAAALLMYQTLDE